MFMNTFHNVTCVTKSNLEGSTIRLSNLRVKNTHITVPFPTLTRKLLVEIISILFVKHETFPVTLRFLSDCFSSVDNTTVDIVNK